MTNETVDQARAQVDSIAEMVAALHVDFDRLAELREKRDAGCWVAGWNIPGYMPDSEPARFDDCDDARGYIVDELRREAETIEDYEPLDLDGLAGMLDKRIGDPEEELGATIGKYHYWITHLPGELADEDEAEELADLEKDAGDCTSEYDAREWVYDDPLSIEYRSAWASPGEDMEPAEFRIVLCTGGPHVEIQGEIDMHGEPIRPRVIYNDWGTSGELFDFDHETVLEYCRNFISG